jgi:tetratricopeptide (TPR) repeat protein
MKHGLPFVFVFLCACGAARHHRGYVSTTIAAAAEEYLVNGNTNLAREQLEAELEKGEPSPAACFLLGDILDTHGEPDAALSLYIRAIETAHQKTGAESIATAAAMGIVAIRDRVDGFAVVFDKLMSRLQNQPGQLPAEAWFQLQNLRFGLARRQGNFDEAASIPRQTGCLVNWQTAGPAGPWTWSNFDIDSHLTNGAPWPAAVDLGLGRGHAKVREINSRTCFVDVRHPIFELEGTTWNRTQITLEQPTRVRLRLQTNVSAIVRVGGVEVFRRDLRHSRPPNISWFEADVPAGNIDIVVELTSAHNTAVFSLLAVDQAGRPAFLNHSISNKPATRPSGVRPIHVKITDSPKAPPVSLVHRFGEFKKTLWWDDIDGARSILQQLSAQSTTLSPALLLVLAEATAADPSLPGEVAYEQSRALLQQALDEDSSLWQARINLADRELAEDRINEAVTLLKTGIELSPGEPELLLRLINTFGSSGWTAETLATLATLEKLMPNSCNTLSWKLVAARQVLNFDEATRIAKELAACDSSSSARAEELTRKQHWKKALEQRQRLAEQAPLDASAAFDVAKAAIAASNPDMATQSIKDALKLTPSSAGMRVALADILDSTGDTEAARLVLEDGLNIVHGPQPLLEAALAALDHRERLVELRLDGSKIIERYIAGKHEYDTASVFVLDRMVHRVEPDGSTAIIVHTITQLKTDEAIEAHGEFQLPSGASLLNARTIKRDGTILEPENIAHKSTLSLPDLNPGDFIEIEYVTYAGPNQLFPGGFDTERFYFQNFDTAFHRSEMVVIVPESIQVITDPRSACPQPIKKTSGTLVTYLWRMRGVLPHPNEPTAPNPTEFLPSIRVSSKASWNDVLSRMRNLLADKSKPSRHTEAVLKEAIGQIDETAHHDKRRAIYRWTMDHIEPDEDMFEQGSHIIVRRAGDRGRAFAYLLAAAGYQSRLALVHPLYADATKSNIPDFTAFSRFVVAVPDDGFISFEQTHAPYGYLSAALRQRPVIYIDNAESTKTDEGAVALDTQYVDLTVSIGADGAGKIKIKETLNGILATTWRAELAQIPENEKQHRFQESYLSKIIPSARLVQLKILEEDNPAAPLYLVYEIDVPSLARPDGEGNRRLELPFALDLLKTLGALPIRITPLIAATRIKRRVLATVSIPKDFQLTFTDDHNRSIDGKWGKASRSIEKTGDTIRLGFTSKISIDRVPPKQYQKFFEEIRQIDQVSKLELIMARTPQH